MRRFFRFTSQRPLNVRRIYFIGRFLDLFTFLTRIGQTPKDCFRVICNELWVVHVKLLDCIAAGSRQDLSCHDIHPRNVVLIELVFWIHDSTQIV